MTWLDRQSFLAVDSEHVLAQATVGIAGLGGGGSHVAQQLTHVGIGNFVLLDDDTIDETNLNRLIGGRREDIAAERPKLDIARRLILGINPRVHIRGRKAVWQDQTELVKTCDIVIGGLDSVRAKNELEAFCRRYLIPYIDMGMDVHETERGHLIAGQVMLSMPGRPCLRCAGIVRDEALAEEGRRYGAAGGKPQVIWPNGVLASAAVGLALQLITPWHRGVLDCAYLEYDGNRHTLTPSLKFERIAKRACPHYPLIETGDPGFDIRHPPTSN